MNLFDTKTDDIAYYYTYRLAGRQAGGAAGKVPHPAEPLEIGVELEARF